jgi:hypothetical protein
MSEAPRRREAAIRALLVMGSLVVAYLMAEAAVRLLGYAPERYPAMARLVDRGWTTLLDCYPTNPRGYFDIDLRLAESRERYRWLAPNRFDQVAQRAPHAIKFEYNSLRFRDRPLEAKPPGVTRVMIVGDSFTEGQGVKEPETYPRVLEQRLGAGFEVRNCARRGLDFPDLMDVFDDAIPFGADLVVYAMVLNDGARSPEFQARQTYLNDWILTRGWMEMRGETPHPWWEASRVAALVADRWEQSRVSRDTTRWYQEMYGEANEAGWRRTQGFIRKMDERTRAQGGRLMVVLWPLLVDLNDRYPFESSHDSISAFCRAVGIPFFDLRQALSGPPSRSLWVHPLDRHPNEIAHRMAADALAPVVKEIAQGPR